VAGDGDGGGQLRRRHLHRSQDGGFFASASPDAKHLPKPIKQREDNVTTTRFFTLLASYSGEARYRGIAEAGMGYLGSPAVLEAYAFLPDVLLAEEEMRNEPVHVTVVGAKAIRAAPRSTPARWPIRSPTSARSGGTRPKASSPTRTSTTRISRGPGGICLHAQFLLAAGDRRSGDPGADRPAAALLTKIGALHFPPHSYGEVSR
jgi:hypothetical protein